MGKRLRKVEHVNCARHSQVHEARQFVVSGNRKADGIAGPLRQRTGIHAARPIEDRPAGRSSWTPNWKRRARLARRQERNRMALGRPERPRNRVTRVYPVLIREKRPRLPGPVGTLDTCDCMPDFRVQGPHDTCYREGDHGKHAGLRPSHIPL